MSAEDCDVANVGGDVLPILNSYAEMVGHPAKALALLRDKECISFLLLQLNGEDEMVVGLALRILHTLSVSLGHYKHELAETFGYKNSLESHLLDITPRSTAARRCHVKLVNMYFYEPLDECTREGVTADLTSMKGIVSVTFNMLGSVCNLRVTKELKKTDLVDVLINNGIHGADLGLFKDGKEERIAVGRREVDVPDLPEYLPDNYVPSPERPDIGHHVIATKEQLHVPQTGSSGFRSLWKGVSSFLDTYF
uniref:Armadillo repeat-containing protein 1 n=1 Tax=Trichuris muris TaxID=70415 RepID=A0A5S6QMZ2_TRIMR